MIMEAAGTILLHTKPIDATFLGRKWTGVGADYLNELLERTMLSWPTRIEIIELDGCVITDGDWPIYLYPEPLRTACEDSAAKVRYRANFQREPNQIPPVYPVIIEAAVGATFKGTALVTPTLGPDLYIA